MQSVCHICCEKNNLCFRGIFVFKFISGCVICGCFSLVENINQVKMKCFISSCKNASHKRSPGISFHGFPQEDRMRVMWLRKIGCQSTELAAHDVICSEHFFPNDLILQKNRTLLAKNAVPELNLNSVQQSQVAPDNRTSVECTTNTQEMQVTNVIKTEVDNSENFIKVEEDEEFMNSEFLPIEGNEDIDTLKNVLTSELRSSYWHCGEILSSKNGNLILVCTFCEEYFHKIEDFNKHLDNHRSKSHKSNEDEKQSESHVSINSTGVLPLNNEQEEFVSSEPQLLDIEELRAQSISGIVDNLDFHIKEEIQDEDLTQTKKKKRKKSSKKLEINANLFCEMCKKWFKTETTMNRHLMSCRAAMEYDSIQFKTNEIATDEESQKIVEAAVSSGPMVFAEPLNINKCKFCPRSFRHNLERIEHECLHTGDKLYKCSICDKRFRTKNNFNRHEWTHQKIKPHKCHICDATFADKTNCTVHIRRHLGEKPYKCDYCEMSFVVNTERKHHQRQHTGEKPYKCDQCGASFPSGSRLNSHLVKHRAERPFKCDECGKGCLTAAFLKDHKIVAHTNKRLECPICGVKVVRKKNLKTHMLLHSDVKSYLCSICGKGFHQRTGLTIHLKTHSNKETATK